jgi:hypothetical protein
LIAVLTPKLIIDSGINKNYEMGWNKWEKMRKKLKCATFPPHAYAYNN